MKRRERGQGLVGASMGVSLVTVLVMVGAAMVGPAVNQLLALVGPQFGSPAAITGVIAERSGDDGGNAVHVTVGVTGDTPVSVSDEITGETMGPVLCRGSCLVILAGIGPEAGRVAVTTGAGPATSAEYAPGR